MNIHKVLLSTSDDSYGIGCLLEIDVYEKDLERKEDDSGHYLTDIHGDVYYCYDFVKLEAYKSRRDLIFNPEEITIDLRQG